MPKFVFQGDYNGDREVIEAHGYTFAGREPTEVPDSDERAIAKLRGNGEFEESGAKKETDEIAAAKELSRETASKTETKRRNSRQGTRGAAKAKPEEPPEPSVTKRSMEQVSRAEEAGAEHLDREIEREQGE